MDTRAKILAAGLALLAVGGAGVNLSRLLEDEAKTEALGLPEKPVRSRSEAAEPLRVHVRATLALRRASVRDRLPEAVRALRAACPGEAALCAQQLQPVEDRPAWGWLEVPLFDRRQLKALRALANHDDVKVRFCDAPSCGGRRLSREAVPDGGVE